MDADLAVGWIGLGGAAIGAGAAILGGWLQQKAQAKTAKLERQEGYSRNAAETALNELLLLQRNILAALAAEGYDEQDLVNDTVNSTHSARFSMMLVMHADEVRRRMDEVFSVLTYALAAPSGDSRIRRYLTASEEGLNILSSYLRDEPLAAPSQPFSAYLQSLGLINPNPE